MHAVSIDMPSLFCQKPGQQPYALILLHKKEKQITPVSLVLWPQEQRLVLVRM